MCERPDFYNSKIVKAKQSHKCCECDGVIVLGDRYLRVSGKWDGEVHTFKTCQSCSKTWAYIAENLEVECQWHGGLAEIIEELEILNPEDEEDIDGPTCTIGTLVPWLRRGRFGRWELVAF